MMIVESACWNLSTLQPPATRSFTRHLPSINKWYFRSFKVKHMPILPTSETMHWFEGVRTPKRHESPSHQQRVGCCGCLAMGVGLYLSLSQQVVRWYCGICCYMWIKYSETCTVYVLCTYVRTYVCMQQSLGSKPFECLCVIFCGSSEKECSEVTFHTPCMGGLVQNPKGGDMYIDTYISMCIYIYMYISTKIHIHIYVI